MTKNTVIGDVMMSGLTSPWLIEDRETPESFDGVTTATLQHQRSNGDEEHMDVKMSSSDSNPDSDRYEGALS